MEDTEDLSINYATLSLEENKNKLVPNIVILDCNW